jgi:hypothetical protein
MARRAYAVRMNLKRIARRRHYEGGGVSGTYTGLISSNLKLTAALTTGHDDMLSSGVIL